MMPQVLHMGLVGKAYPVEQLGSMLAYPVVLPVELVVAMFAPVLETLAATLAHSVAPVHPVEPLAATFAHPVATVHPVETLAAPFAHPVGYLAVPVAYPVVLDLQVVQLQVVQGFQLFRRGLLDQPLLLVLQHIHHRVV
jgi:hypothetical protein